MTGALPALAAEAPVPTDAVPLGPALAAAPKVQIGNGLIRATLLVPDAERGFYKGHRFDWAGQVSSLKLGNQEFYGPWFDKLSQQARDVVYDGDQLIAGPHTATFGPVEEFDLNVPPPGFAQAAPGGTFLKPGVGALRRPDDAPYSSFRRYDYVDPGVRTLRRTSRSVEFRHRVSTADGWGYDYVKRLSLTPGKPQLVIDHTLRNTGRNAIGTTVYNHNFLTFGGVGIGPELTVTTPYEIKTTRPLPADAAARLERNRLVYLRRLVDRDRVSTSLEGFGPTAADHRFRIECAPLRAGVEIVGDRPLSQVQVWSIRTNVSVEPFVRLDIAPGQTARWSHTNTYWAGSAA